MTKMEKNLCNVIDSSYMSNFLCIFKDAEAGTSTVFDCVVDAVKSVTFAYLAEVDRENDTRRAYEDAAQGIANLNNLCKRYTGHPFIKGICDLTNYAQVLKLVAAFDYACSKLERQATTPALAA